MKAVTFLFVCFVAPCTTAILAVILAERLSKERNVLHAVHSSTAFLDLGDLGKLIPQPPTTTAAPGSALQGFIKDVPHIVKFVMELVQGAIEHIKANPSDYAGAVAGVGSKLVARAAPCALKNSPFGALAGGLVPDDPLCKYIKVDMTKLSQVDFNNPVQAVLTIIKALFGF